MSFNTISVLPLDVGFDIRKLGVAVRLPSDCDGVTYLTKAGNIRTVHGDANKITRTLQVNGYKVWIV